MDDYRTNLERVQWLIQAEGQLMVDALLVGTVAADELDTIALHPFIPTKEGNGHLPRNLTAELEALYAK